MHCKKRAYRDKDEAVLVLHGLMRKLDGKKKPVRAYLCDDYGKWHLTSKEIGEMSKTGYNLTQDWSGLTN